MPSPRQGPADPRTCPPRTLPGINPFLNHRDPAHKASFDTFLRSATASRRGPALALTAALLSVLARGQPAAVAFACVSALASAVPLPADLTGQTSELLCGLGFELALLGVAADAAADSGGSGAMRLLAAVAVTQVALFHQLTLPGWPVTPLRLAVRLPPPPLPPQLPSAAA